ncbi:MAG: class I poly(R)-hydroxyalkanoic acid synthase [Burkholderiales bacterium]|nr:MAG: class I poly(R)-hydroxyalkanoic acid synthase [Burkholderiales bacterium]
MAAARQQRPKRATASSSPKRAPGQGAARAATVASSDPLPADAPVPPVRRTARGTAKAASADAATRGQATTPASPPPKPASPPPKPASPPSKPGAAKRRAGGTRAPAAAATRDTAAPPEAAVRSAVPPSFVAKDLAPTSAGAFPMWSIDPTRLLSLQNEYATRLQDLWSGFLKPEGAPPALGDKRFSAPEWTKQTPFAWSAALYLLNADFLQRMADSVDADAKTRERIRFFTQQWVDALSPSNFLPTNPEAQQLLLDSNGDSLRHGIENLLADIGKGHISMTDESAFEVGRNVGTSKGAVVFRNDVIELIQYSPSTPTVGTRPLLLVPPFINKYYILDLQPENSFVAHAVSRGHTVFLVSWINAQPEHGKLTWDDYIERGIVEAIHRVQTISRSDTINALGFCVGGTILATGLAALAARGEKPVASLTLMTTLLDFEEPGVLGVFIDPAQVGWREQTLGDGGLMTGQELATTFSFLRPNDLVWNYVVANYLKGKAPPAFDLLYWNSDGTNLPGPLYCWYLRHMYLQNELRVPNALTCMGEKIDLRRIDVPTYIFGAREDHIVPWRAAYGSTQLLSNRLRFALGASGHIAGAINPASKNKRSYWIGESLPASPDAWLAGAVEHPGSWWNDWAAWLEAFKGPEQPAPARLGDAANPPLEPAPGRYVKMKAKPATGTAGTVPQP